MPKRDSANRTTTVQVSTSVRKQLAALKKHPRETLNDVLERLIEDQQELSPAFVRHLEKALEDIKAGRVKSHEEVRAELGL
jgi:predicted transcriptional regulator